MGGAILGLTFILIAMFGGYTVMNSSIKRISLENKEYFTKYDDIFKLYAGSVPWRWVKAIAIKESDNGQDPLVKAGKVSSDGLSYGIMQIAELKGSAVEISIKGNGGPALNNDPNYSIQKGAELLNYLFMKYNGDMNKVFLAYNQGERNTDNGKDYTNGYDKDVIEILNEINAKEKLWQV